MDEPGRRSSGARICSGLVVTLACAALAACATPQIGPSSPSPGSLAQARQACTQQYPRRIGNYLPHARCVNAAVEAFALPTARYPDLIRLQEEVRTNLSDRIDRRRISAHLGEHRMTEADRMIDSIGRKRDAADREGADRQLAAVKAMLR